MNKMIIAGILAAAVLFSGLGIMAMAQEDDFMTKGELDEFTLVEAESEDPNAQYLLTEEQIETMKTTAQELRDAHATRTEIRETVQAMAYDYVQENLESYGLNEEEIVEIQAKLTELMEKMLEVRETAHDLWEQDMNRQDIREEIQPLMEEAQEIRGELKELLDQYGILPPEIGHPGMGGGHGHGGRPGGFGRPDDAGRPDGAGGHGGFGGFGGFGGHRP